MPRPPTPADESSFQILPLIISPVIKVILNFATMKGYGGYSNFKLIKSTAKSFFS